MIDSYWFASKHVGLESWSFVSIKKVAARQKGKILYGIFIIQGVVLFYFEF